MSDQESTDEDMEVSVHLPSVMQLNQDGRITLKQAVSVGNLLLAEDLTLCTTRVKKTIVEEIRKKYFETDVSRIKSFFPTNDNFISTPMK